MTDQPFNIITGSALPISPAQLVQLIQCLGGYRPITGYLGVQIKFRYLASFQNDGRRKVTAVEIQDQFSDFYTIVMC